jgi:membrane carboxypeptidase/penicillin-binding protein
MSPSKKIILSIGLPLGALSVYLVAAFLWAFHCSEIALQNYEKKFNTEFTLSEDQVSALLLIEDPSFWSNNGIDISHPGQGKTTMTQSVVPLLLFTTELSGWKGTLQSLYQAVWKRFKFVDLGRDVMALAIAKKIPKNKIIKLFSERAYLGTVQNKSIVGFSAAANEYFNKQLHELSTDEFAGLVGMLKSPDFFNPRKHPDHYRERQVKVSKVIRRICVPVGLFDTDYASCS